MLTTRNYQIKPIKFLKENKSSLLALDMGLGKTYCVIKAFSEREEKILIVITKKTTFWNSERPWDFTFKGLGIDFLKMNKKSCDANLIIFKQKLKETAYKKQGFVMTYGNFTKFYKMFFSKLKIIDLEKFLFVFDECQTAKNRTSQIGKSVFALSKQNNFERIVLMTGTPINKGSSSNQDLFNYMRILGFGLLKTYYKNWIEFKDNFLVSVKTERGGHTFDVFTGNKNTEVLLGDLYSKSHFMTVEQSGMELPEEIEEVIEIEYEKEIKNAMKNKVYKEWMAKTAGNFASTRTAMSSFLYTNDQFNNRILVKFSSNNKLDALRDILESTEDKILVFYNFNQELEFIKQICIDLGRTFGQINGHLDDRIDKSVIAIQYQAGSEGIDGLQEDGFRRIIFYSPTLEARFYMQAKRRTRRSGQKEVCFVYNFITKNSIETNIFATLKKGQNYTEKMFDDFEKENE